MAKEDERPSGSAVLPRNFNVGRDSAFAGPFTLTLEERLRALASGPPAFAIRRRRIETLEAAIVRALAEHEAKDGAPLDAEALPYAVTRELERLNRLIDDHNRYYPIEARLPMDVRSGQLMDWGEPWVPMPLISAEALVAAARRNGR